MKRSQEDMKELNRHLGQNLLAIRKHLKLSQPEMGAMIGVTAQQWYKYESGQNYLSTADSALLIVSGIPVSWIYRGIDRIIMSDPDDVAEMRYRFEQVAQA